MSEKSGVVEFIKGVVKWSAIWTAILLSVVTMNSISKGEAITIEGLVVTGILMGILSFALVVVWKVIGLAHGVGRKIGNDLVDSRIKTSQQSGDNAVKGALSKLPRAAGPGDPRP